MVGRLILTGSLVLFSAWGQANGIPGKWRRTVGSDVFQMEFKADGSGTLNGLPLRWTLAGSQLTILPGDGSARRSNIDVTATTLTMTVPGSSQQIVFERVAEPARAAANEPCRTVVGTWRSPDMVVTLGADGTTVIGGINYRYTADAATLTFTGSDGTFRIPYQLSGGVLTVDLNGRRITLTCAAPGAPGSSAQAATGSNPPELVGRWFYLSNFNTYNGGRMSTSFVQLNADGTYEYSAETSSSGPVASSATAERDYGTWTATENTITARSRVRGTVTTYRLEKRNHPKNTRDPMIVLDGQAFVTATPRNPW